MKKIIIILICSLFFTSCNFYDTPEITVSDYLLGTLVSVKVYDDAYRSAAEACLNKVREFEGIVSYEDNNSELSYMNSKAYIEPVHISDELFEIIEISLEYCEKTDGAFDIGLGRLIELWGIGTADARVPSEDELKPFIGFKGYEHISVDSMNKTVYFTDERVQIHLGACAKGYAEDLARDFLCTEGIDSAILDFGGSISCIGTKPDGKSFSIGIASPFEDGVAGYIGLADISAVTSGNYQRYFMKNNVRYHHIFDSETAYPAENGISSVTVVCESAFKADCLSTAAFVIGKDKAAELLEAEGCQYIIFADCLQKSDNLTFYEQNEKI